MDHAAPDETPAPEGGVSGTGEPIAIIGLGCRFPGGATSPDAYWNLLRQGVDAIGEVPADRWSVRAYFAPFPQRTGRTYSRWGGFVDGIDQFDAAFFGISSREAASMDPQQRMFLEVAWEALESAGLTREALAGRRVGVFAGASSSDYAHLQRTTDRSQSTSGPYTNSGGALSIISNRLSYLLDLRGPSLTIDTACSSSLVALHFACESLRSGESELAVVGGANALLDPGPFIGFSAAHMLSPDGRCRSFSAAANGYARAEGAGAIVLKPLSQAVHDGDPVLAVLLATGVNQDGRTAGLSLPNEEAQASLLEQVYFAAGIAAEEVGYVEAHGTGTPVGDPIEARALGRVLGRPRADGSRLRIGSVKSNFGHLEPASGVAGVMKCVLALQHREIPPSLHAESLNPSIDFEGLGLDVVRERTAWRDRRICGVNSFGFGGTNAHAVLAAAPAERAPTDAVGGKKLRNGSTHPPAAGAGKPPASPVWAGLEVEPVGEVEPSATSLLLLSAASESALEAAAGQFREWITAPREGDAVPDLEEAAWTLARRRTHHPHRLAVVARDAADAASLLSAWRSGEKRREIAAGRTSPGHRPRMAFVFNGMGSQWAGMGSELLETEPEFRRTVEEIDALLRARSGASVLELLQSGEFARQFDEAEVAQPAIFTVQAGLTALFRSWGVTPDCVIGHSVGEVAAAQAAGALSLEEAVNVIWHRSRLQQTLRGRGRMLAVGLSHDLVQHWVESCAGRVAVAAVNSPASVTLSGGADDLEELYRALQAGQTFCRFLNVDVPYHSPAMEEIGEALQSSLNGIPPRATSVKFYSTVLGGVAERPQLDGEYWRRNAREPVLFQSALQALLEDGVELILEIGAHPVLASSIRECQGAAGDPAPIISTLRRNEPQRGALQAALGRLYVAGTPVDWSRVFPERRRVVSLPAYPWQRESCWSESADNRAERLGQVMAGAADVMGPLVYPLLGHPVRTPQQERVWVIRLDLTAEHDWLADHQVQGTPVFPGAGYVELALAAGRTLYPGRSLALEQTTIHRPLVLSTARSTILESLADPYSGDVQLKSRGSDGNSTLHASGRVLPDFQPWDENNERLDDVRSRCGEPQPIAGIYDYFQSLGLNYGPAFRGIEEVAIGEGLAYGRIRFPEGLIVDAEYFVLCPAVLDACLQVMLLATRRQNGPSATYLPVRLERLRLRDPVAASAAVLQGVQVTARILEQTESRLLAEASLYDQSGRVIADVQGIEALALPSQQRVTRSEDCLWKHRFEQRPAAGTVLGGGLPSPAELAAKVRGTIDQLRVEEDRSTFYAELQPQLSRLCTAYFVRGLRELGVGLAPGQVLHPSSLAEKLAIVEPYSRLLHAMLAALVRTGDAERCGDEFRIVRTPAVLDPRAEWRAFSERWPELGTVLLLPCRAGDHLVGILRGEVTPLEVVFPDGSSALLETLYEDSPQFRTDNRMLQQLFAELSARLAAERPLRVLEVGGGTGGATSYLLPMLPVERTDYLFTDVTSQFLGAAEQKFRDYPFVRCATLDVERDPLEQGFSPRSFDVVFAGDVLHAATDLRSAIERLRGLLTDDGLLVLMEPVLQDATLDLCLGILRGWWHFTDTELRRESPLLSIDRWRSFLAEAGFADVQVLTDARSGEAPVHAILVARITPRTDDLAALVDPTTSEPSADRGDLSAAFPADTARESTTTTGVGWILADRGPVAQTLRQQLEEAGWTVVLIHLADEFHEGDGTTFRVRLHQPEDFRRLVESARRRGLAPQVVVHAGGIDGRCRDDLTLDELRSDHRRSVLPALHLLQALAGTSWSRPPRVWFVTRGAQSVGLPTGTPLGLGGAPLWGMARVAQNELSPLRCSVVDLSPDPGGEELQALCRELTTAEDETEVVLRGTARYVPRLTSAANHFRETFCSEAGLRVAVSTPGILESTGLVSGAAPADPGSGEVQIEVAAASVNFKDVAKSLRLLADSTLADTWSGRSLGLECAGRVTAVGAGVTHVDVGDRVVAIAADCFRARLNVPAGFVCRIPDRMSTVAAAALPVVFLTAQLALRKLGQVQPGERVLIHAAAGGVGLAALQVARLAGAEVIATAGSGMKRDYLRALGVRHVFDSRSLAFVEDVRRVTGGRGVDVVLNSLAGAMIPASLSLLAQGGRFIEIGKRDIQENVSLGLRPFDNNLAFLALDLDRLLHRSPEVLQPMLSELMASFATETFTPIPLRTFPVSRAGEAFRHMAKARQIGKVVLQMRDNAIPFRISRPIRRSPPRIDPDGTYLVTGGLSGFGLATARWLVERGARHVALLGRRDPTTLEVQQELLELQEAGARVLALSCDVANPERLAAALATIRETLPPLKGILHAAMVLDDALLVHLNPDRMEAVFAPKIHGAWNLHTLTRDDPVELFVLFSSATVDIGNPGQANYVAACTFLDQLAEHRRQLGLPAVSVAWGAVDDVGYLARNRELHQHVTERMGLPAIPASRLLEILEEILTHRVPTVSVVDFDFSRVPPTALPILRSPRMAAVASRTASAADETSESSGRMRELLREAPPEERRGLLKKYLVEILAGILGTSPSRVETDRSVLLIGLDSLMAVELQTRVARELGREIPSMRLMSGPTIDELVDEMAEQMNAGGA